MKLKVKFSKKILVYLLVGLVFFGLGVGSMILKEKLFPTGESTAVAVKEKGPLVELKEFTVNLDGGGIVKTEITVEGINEDALTELEEEKAFLRDKALAILASQKITDVSTAVGREKLKNTLLTELNNVSNNKIQDVLFNSFMYSI